MAEIGNITVKVDAVITDEQYREAMGAVRTANERMDLLEADNTKLRELVRHLMACGRNKDCDTCPYREKPCDFDYDVRELGIEVDE